MYGELVELFVIRRFYIKRVRINNQIFAKEVRLIDETGQNLGIVAIEQAKTLARERGLDLIEVAPEAKPPVCRIMDFGKYQYQKLKEERQQRAKQRKTTETKGIRLRLQTSQHDLLTKAKQAEKFMNKNCKARIEIILRGREKALFQLANEKIKKFIDLIPLKTKTEESIKKTPRGLAITISKA